MRYLPAFYNLPFPKNGTVNLGYQNKIRQGLSTNNSRFCNTYDLRHFFEKMHFCLPGLVEMAGVPGCSWMVVGVDTSIVVGCNDTTGRKGGVSLHRGWLMASRACGGAVLVKVVGRTFDTTPFWMNFLSVMWTYYKKNKLY